MIDDIQELLVTKIEKRSKLNFEITQLQAVKDMLIVLRYERKKEAECTTQKN